MIAKHGTGSIEGGVSRPKNSETQGDPDGVNRGAIVVVVVCGRWGCRGMLCEDSIHQTKSMELIRQGARAYVSVVVHTNDHVITGFQRRSNRVKKLGIEKSTRVRLRNALRHKVRDMLIPDGTDSRGIATRSIRSIKRDGAPIAASKANIDPATQTSGIGTVRVLVGKKVVVRGKAGPTGEIPGGSGSMDIVGKKWEGGWINHFKACGEAFEVGKSRFSKAVFS